MDKLVNDLRAGVLKSFTDSTLGDDSEEKPEYEKVNNCSVGRIPAGSVAEAILYFHQEISCWLDADGALGWVGQVMEEMEDEGILKRKSFDNCLIIYVQRATRGPSCAKFSFFVF
jgi:hypothetical protein